VSDISPEAPEPAEKQQPESPGPVGEQRPSAAESHREQRAGTAEANPEQRPSAAESHREQRAGTAEANPEQRTAGPTAKERITAERAATDAPTATGRRRGAPVVTALVALLVGAAAAFGGLYLAGWRQVPEEKYTMVVILKDGTSQQQKDEIQKVLETLPGHSAVRLVGKAEAFAEAQKAYASKPDALAGLKEENMPESFRLTAVQRGFDCTALKPLGGNAAISKMSVVKPYGSETDPGADVLC
jgi:FtsX extracellular domain